MSAIDDVIKQAGQLAQNIGNSVANVGHDAQTAVNKAVSNTAQLAASGVNHAGQIFGPLGDAFGHDPQEFALNLAKRTSRQLRDVLIRTANRTGTLNYTFHTAQGLRKVPAKPPATASAAQLALTMALAALDSPATMIEEAGRQASGLPQKERGLMGFTEYRVMLPPRALSPSPESGAQARGVFGVDDALLAILPIALPIIVSIAAQILPGLIAAAGAAITAVVNPGPTKEQQAAAAAQQQAQQQGQTMMTVGIVGGVLLLTGVGVYFAMRKKKAA